MGMKQFIRDKVIPNYYWYKAGLVGRKYRIVTNGETFHTQRQVLGLWFTFRPDGSDHGNYLKEQIARLKGNYAGTF